MRYLMLAGALVLLALSRPSVSNAMPFDNPPGSYQQSCKNISVRGDDLRARCKDVYGHYRDAFLDHADRCWGDISNNNGTLVCEKNGSPRGSFVQSCRDVRVRWNVLMARCETREGRWVDASLEQYSRCNAEIVNDDGRLRCAGRDWDRDRDRDRDRDGDRDRDRDNDRDRYLPRGSYAQSCRDIRTRGDDLIAVCETINGQWAPTTLDGFNRCSGDIVNDNGRLECTRQGGRLVPVGSYSQTCRNVYVRGDVLRAQCQDREGRWNWSQLNDWDDCRRGIVNEDGRLRCNR